MPSKDEDPNSAEPEANGNRRIERASNKDAAEIFGFASREQQGDFEWSFGNRPGTDNRVQVVCIAVLREED